MLLQERHTNGEQVNNGPLDFMMDGMLFLLQPSQWTQAWDWHRNRRWHGWVDLKFNYAAMCCDFWNFTGRRKLQASGLQLIQLLLSHSWRFASMSAAGWPPTVSSWIQRRPNYWLRYSTEAQLGSNGLSVHFGTEVISASDHVRVLGVTISSDLSLDKHVANVCSFGFYCLCQLRRVRRSLDTDAIKTLIPAFVMLCADCCKEGRFCLITEIHYWQAAVCTEHCSASRHWHIQVRPRLVTHGELHWLDVPERIHYKLGVTVHRCLQFKALE